MIITKTPFRMSFFGGGTDYPQHYNEHGGAVLATSINKYCYISCRVLPAFFEHRYRIAYSKIETVSEIDEIEHPAVKGVLNYMNQETGVEIQHVGDLPARSGLGSSSAFTAGLLHSLYALRGKLVSKYDLAMETIEIEQNIMGEIVGSQDQVTCAMGGLNVILFKKNNEIEVKPVVISQERKDLLNDHLLLFFTGLTRYSADVTVKKVKAIKKKPNRISLLKDLVHEGVSILTSDADIMDFGKLLHEGWKIKRGISTNISNTFIDELYSTALANGALGGKLLGAGGGGFLAVFAPPEKHDKIIATMKGVVHVPFRFENGGSSICVFEPQGL